MAYRSLTAPHVYAIIIAMAAAIALRARIQPTCFTFQDHHVVDEFYRNPEPRSCRTV